MCPCACRAPIACCSVPAAASTRRRCSRMTSSCSISTATSFIIPAASFRWNGVSTTRIHRDRPECMCIAHLHARHATVLGIASHDIVPVFLHGSFLHGGVPTWDDPQLVVNDEQAADLS